MSIEKAELFKKKFRGFSTFVILLVFYKYSLFIKYFVIIKHFGRFSQIQADLRQKESQNNRYIQLF